MSEKLITMTELAEKYKDLPSDEIILDVRTPEEYQQVHIPGSLNLPLAGLPVTYEKLKDYKAVYIHCKMGGRAKQAYDLLTDLGLNNLHCLKEAGIVGWEDAGHPCNKP